MTIYVIVLAIESKTKDFQDYFTENPLPAGS